MRKKEVKIVARSEDAQALQNTRRIVGRTHDEDDAAGQVISFLETKIPDFLRDATVDAIHEAAEYAGLPVPTFDGSRIDRELLASILADAAAGRLTLRGEDKQSRTPLTLEDAGKIGETIVLASDFDEEVTWPLILLLDEIAAASFDQTRVENLAAAARDSAFGLTVECTHALNVQVAKRRAQWAKQHCGQVSKTDTASEVGGDNARGREQ